MQAVAEREGVRSTFGQSPFAVARGQTFERGLFREEAKTLRVALEEAGVLSSGSRGFVDLRLKQHGGPARDMDDALSRTRELLRNVAGGQRNDRPTIVASPTLLIPAGVMLPEALLLVDVVTIAYGDVGATLTVGEVKTYPDRGGHTDSAQLALARAQAGVYVHALRMVLAELDLADRITVSDQGFLVLSRPGFNRPSVRAGEDLRYQAMRAERGFRQLEAAAATLPRSAGSRDPQSDTTLVDAVLAASTAYDERCVSFCDRAEACRRRAISEGNPEVLGHDVARFLGDLSLTRAVELLNGARPRSDAEKEIKRQLRVVP
jgi:hypothetical protein